MVLIILVMSMGSAVILLSFLLLVICVLYFQIPILLGWLEAYQFH